MSKRVQKLIILLFFASLVLTACSKELTDVLNLNEQVEINGSNIDEVITEALDIKRSAFLPGDFFCSTYHVLQRDEDATGATLYLLVTHGWYSRIAAYVEQVSGCGIVCGVLRVTRESDLYAIEKYSEYEIKQLLDSSEEVFPASVIDEVLANEDDYYVMLKEAMKKKVIEHFGYEHDLHPALFQR